MLGAFSKTDASIECLGSHKGSLIPRSRLKFSLNPEIPTVGTGVLANLDPPRFGSPSPNPLADMDTPPPPVQNMRIVNAYELAAGNDPSDVSFDQGKMGKYLV